MTLSRNEACRRLSSLGIRQELVHGIIDTVNSWTKSNGQEWTVGRLKQLKVDYIRLLAGLPTLHHWIKVDKLGVPKGPFGSLFRLKGKKVHVKVLNALMCYSTFTSDRITEKQWKKFHSSVTESKPEDTFFLRIAYNRVDFDSLMTRSKPYAEVLDNVTLGNTNVPHYSKGRLKEHQLTEWLPNVAQYGISRKLSGMFPNVFAGLKPDCQKYWSRCPFGDETGHPVMGSIGFIQEPGFKLRAVANPDRILQFALEPLRKEIASIVKKIDTDCTFNQDKGVERVQKWLQEGETVYSVDLSDATNNFPLSFQVMLLEKLLPNWHEHVKLFEYASRGEWRVNGPSGIKSTISWTKGQPLGLGPSFVSFALAHNLLVQGLKTGNDEFVILGDDIAIKGSKLNNSYRQALSHLGCPISEDKCLVSNQVAEFGGKVITKDDIIQPYKWRKVSDRNFLTLAHNLGPQVLGILQPNQRRIVKALAPIPEEYGGLGWNPKGLSYGDRVFQNWELIRTLETNNTVPCTDVSKQVVRLRAANIRMPTFQEFFSEARPKAEASATPTRSSEMDVRTRVILDTGVHEENFRPEEKRPQGFRPMVKESDPRAKTVAQQMMEKLYASRKASKIAQEQTDVIPEEIVPPVPRM